MDEAVLTTEFKAIIQSLIHRGAKPEEIANAFKKALDTLFPPSNKPQS